MIRRLAGFVFVLALSWQSGFAPGQDAPEKKAPRIRQLNPVPPPEDKDEKTTEREPVKKEIPPAKVGEAKDLSAKDAPAKAPEKAPPPKVEPAKAVPPKDLPAKVTPPKDGDADKAPDEKKIPGIEALTAKPFELPLHFNKQVPDDVADLKAMQDQVNAAWKKVMPAIVGVTMGNKAGSAVLVKGGYALTAGHVAISPNTGATFVFPDGKRVKGKTLGVNRNVDGGLMKITEDGDFPYVEMGNAADLKVGQWVICSGHPGGPREGRSPPVRVGRILAISASTIYTDCYIIGGDSGGPLFDLQGRVIGINSRIGQGINQNMHVNINTFRDGWEKLVSGGTGDKVASGPRGYLGVSAETADKKCRITLVRGDSPAEKGGLMPGDIVAKCDTKAIASADEFIEIVRRKNPGETIVLEVTRGEEALTLKVVLGKG